MVFGDAVELPTSSAPADWIAGACGGVWGTVGALVPNHYPSILRVRAPDPSVEDWWSAYRELFGVIAAVGERHTASADRAWFAVWDGYGFATRTTHIFRRTPDDASRQALEQEQSRLREDDERRNSAILTALLAVPTFQLPHREYYLLQGPVAAATELRDPGPRSAWRRPDLCWPDDRRWFIATDTDFWSLYIGGDSELVAELVSRVPTPCELVSPDDHLGIED